jgi:hypothetical protein
VTLPRTSASHLRNALTRRAVAVTTVLASTCIVFGFVAYRQRAAPRGIVVADTVVGYGPRPFRLEARAIRDDGRTATHATLRFVGRSSAGTVSDDGVAQCTGAGAILTTVRAASATSTIVVICRPLRWIRGLMPMVGWGTPSDAPLYVGGPARHLEVQAYDVAGVPVERFSARESVRDSNVARLDHGFVYPVGPGRTTIDLDLDGMAETVQIEVDARVIADSVRLSAGETRDWRLGPGWYGSLARRRSCRPDDKWRVTRGPKRKLRSREGDHAAPVLYCFDRGYDCHHEKAGRTTWIR